MSFCIPVFCIFFLSISFPLHSQTILDLTNGRPIKDADTIILTADLSVSASYNRLSLWVDINHSWINDLELCVINPEGKRARIFYNLGIDPCFGCDGDDMVIRFEDAAPIPFDSLNQMCGNKPAYAGIASPFESLDSLLTESVTGNWMVEIIDWWPFETGYVNDIQLIFDNYNAPSCSSVWYPGTDSLLVPVDACFTWHPVADATGYYLTLGSTPGGAEFLDNQDVGLDTFFCPAILLCESAYYLSVTPYNDYGVAENCSEVFFLTEYVVAETPGDVSVCRGDTVALIASGGSTFEWIPGNFLSDPYSDSTWFFGPESMNYTVIVSNERDCRDTAVVHVSVFSIDIGLDSLKDYRLNDPGYIHLLDNPESGQYSWEWSGPDGFSAQTRDIDSLEAGCYYLTVTDTLTGCQLDTLFCVDDLSRTTSLLQDGFRLYPNPVKETLMLNLDVPDSKPVILSIISPTGQRLQSFQLIPDHSPVRIPVQDLLPGVYTLHLEYMHAEGAHLRLRFCKI